MSSVQDCPSPIYTNKCNMYMDICIYTKVKFKKFIVFIDIIIITFITSQSADPNFSKELTFQSYFMPLTSWTNPANANNIFQIPNPSECQSAVSVESLKSRDHK